MDLKNKTVVIIGGTSGIGLATAVEANQRGAALRNEPIHAQQTKGFQSGDEA